MRTYLPTKFRDELPVETFEPLAPVRTKVVPLACTRWVVIFEGVGVEVLEVPKVAREVGPSTNRGSQ